MAGIRLTWHSCKPGNLASSLDLGACVWCIMVYRRRKAWGLTRYPGWATWYGGHTLDQALLASLANLRAVLLWGCVFWRIESRHRGGEPYVGTHHGG